MYPSLTQSVETSGATPVSNIQSILLSKSTANVNILRKMVQRQLCEALGPPTEAINTKSENQNALMALGTSSLFFRMGWDPDFNIDLLRAAGTYTLISMDKALRPRSLSQASPLGYALLLVQLITLSHSIRTMIPLNGQSDRVFDAMKAHLLDMLIVFVKLILPGALWPLMAMKTFDSSNTEESELSNLWDEIEGCGSVNRMVAPENDLVHPCEVCAATVSAFRLCQHEHAVSVDERYLGAVLIWEIFEALLCKVSPGEGFSQGQR